MCKFFSFVGDGFGNYRYSDWAVRKALIDSKSNDSPDSHTWILTSNNVPPKMQNKWSKYEFNPLTKEFTIDKGREGHDHESAEAWVNSINFKEIAPQLVTGKKIKNPLSKTRKVTENDIALLKEWDSVGASVGESVWASVGESVWASVGESVWASVGASVGDSVRAYTSSFIDCDYGFDFSSCIKLWECGLVPSFDGKTWRLHTGKNAKIVYEWKKDNV